MENNKTLIFDMDGVLVDSEPVILKAAMEGLSEYGVHAKPEDFIPFVGAGEDKFIGGVSKKYGIEYKKEMKKRVYEIYVDIVKDNLKVYEGTGEFLEELRSNGFKLVLASSADRIKVESNLKVAKIGFELFSAVVSGEDVEKKKPFPDIFIFAAKKSNSMPENCIVIEDAINGVKAAASAGMRCIGITSSFSSESLLAAGAFVTYNRVKDIIMDSL